MFPPQWMLRAVKKLDLSKPLIWELIKISQSLKTMILLTSRMIDSQFYRYFKLGILGWWKFGESTPKIRLLHFWVWVPDQNPGSVPVVHTWLVGLSQRVSPFVCTLYTLRRNLNVMESDYLRVEKAKLWSKAKVTFLGSAHFSNGCVNFIYNHMKP